MLEALTQLKVIICIDENSVQLQASGINPLLINTNLGWHGIDSNGSSWAMAVKLNEVGKWFCVDSLGSSKSPILRYR